MNNIEQLFEFLHCIKNVNKQLRFQKTLPKIFSEKMLIIEIKHVNRYGKYIKNECEELKYKLKGRYLTLYD